MVNILGITNINFFSLTYKNTNIYHEQSFKDQKLWNYLSKILPICNNINKIIICNYPGSIISNNNLVSFLLGYFFNKNISIEYISLFDILQQYGPIQLVMLNNNNGILRKDNRESIYNINDIKKKILNNSIITDQKSSIILKKNNINNITIIHCNGESIISSYNNLH